MDQIDEVLGSIEERDNNIYRVYFNTSPIPEEQRKAGFGGINRYKELEGYDNSESVSYTHLDVYKRQASPVMASIRRIPAATNRRRLVTRQFPCPKNGATGRDRFPGSGCEGREPAVRSPLCDGQRR